MECLHPYTVDGAWFPCGKCLPCRIRKKREWVARLRYELNTYKGQALFVTLTYRDEKLPKNKDGIATLRKSDLQKFFKRLRKDLYKSCPNHVKIKYFACGEYGDAKTASRRNDSWNSPLGRPHYHCIIFGVGIDDIKYIRENWLLDDNADWRWDITNKQAVGFVTEDSMGYVAGYVQKKMSQRKGSNKEEILDIEPCFQVSSQRLGYDYVDSHVEGILACGMISDGKHNIGLPQTIKRHLGVDGTSRRTYAIDGKLRDSKLGDYFDKVQQRKDDYASEHWKKTQEKRRIAFKSRVRGKAFVDYMQNVDEATQAVKTAFVSACERKGVHMEIDLL